MANWKELFTDYAANAEERMDTLRHRLHYQLGGVGPIKIVAYRGYGSHEKAYLRGRVLEDRHIPEGEQIDDVWNNLLTLYGRLESHEVPNARLIARFQGCEQEIQADQDGFFEVWMPINQPLAERRLWHPIELDLLHPIHELQNRYPVKTLGQVLIPPSTARQVIISDIDDTLFQADAAHLASLARSVFLGNAQTRLPFPGLAALHRAFFEGKTGREMNPIFYVSSGPWNLYDLLTQFFNLRDIPVGPVLFPRHWGLTPQEMLPTHDGAFKAAVIRQMLDFYPDLPFILLGDSSQEDPEVFADLACQNPRRIPVVYICNVSHDSQRSEALQRLASRLREMGSELVLADDAAAIARHAIEHDFISPSALPVILANQAKDELPPTPLELLLGEANKEIGLEAPAIKETRQQVKHGDLGSMIKEAGAKKTIAKPPAATDEGPDKKNKSRR